MSELDDVLASPTYNQSLSPDEIALYGLMQQSDPSEDVLDQYKETFNSLSTDNPFVGVMTNPMQCEVDQANSEIDDILKQVQGNENVPEWVPKLLEDVQGDLDTYLDHTNRLVGNFPTISSIIQTSIANALGQGSDLGSNPCVAFADVMGSILQAGQDIIDEILVALQDVKANLDKTTALIEGAVNKLMEAIAKAMTKIQEEIDQIAKAMLNMNKMNLASMLKYQNTDPCMKSILAKTLTSEAKNVLGS